MLSLRAFNLSSTSSCVSILPLRRFSGCAILQIPARRVNLSCTILLKYSSDLGSSSACRLFNRSRQNFSRTSRSASVFHWDLSPAGKSKWRSERSGPGPSPSRKASTMFAATGLCSIKSSSSSKPSRSLKNSRR
jgi:hypothetical protein